MENKKTCFIITPIGNESDPIRRHIDGMIDAVIVPSMEGDYEIKVAHRMPETGTITRQILELIYKSDLVIANLTGTNPNVMYELAVRHTLGSPTIIIAEEGTKLPFDISSERTIFYTNDLKGTVDAKKELEKYLKQIDYNDKRATGPIHSYLDTVKLRNKLLNYNEEEDFDQSKHVLELIVKRLESIELLIPNIKNEITSELLNEAIKTAIRQAPDLNVAKLNMNITLLNEMVLQLRKIVDDYAYKLSSIIISLIQYVNNNSISDTNINISSRMFIQRLNEVKSVIDEFKSKVADHVSNSQDYNK